ncbi:MAG: hypothetical protein COA78_12085 [Blastopirellula sp.]|nr:MAG: hypothetical protein COA78_12085 [Blastopirellula sp.]
MKGEITEVFAKSCQLLSLRGYKKLGERTEPVIEKIGDNFSIELDCETLQVKVFHKAMPIGLYGHSCGMLMSGGEDDLIKAFDTEIKLLTTTERK